MPGGKDNINDDLIVSVNDVFISSLGARYIVRDVLGQGTFGQVFKCSNQSNGEMVATKVIKNQAAYYHQARVEVGVLQFLNTKADPTDRSHIVRLKDFFMHDGHLCLVFELLDLNLFELIRHNKFRGLSLSLVRVFTKQLLEALMVLRDSGIIHCDIKPENVLLSDATSGNVKLIDFGSACFANCTVYSYIQSRFYRSPEVVLGHSYNMAVDMWSLGCVAAELFLGLPLFPAACEHDLLGRIVQMFGTLPDWLLLEGKNTSNFFSRRANTMESRTNFSLLTASEFEAVNGKRAPCGKQYFQHTALADVINAYPVRDGLRDEDISREKRARESFTDFLLGLLDVDPETRWTPQQAHQHPFITGDSFNGPFQPVPDSLVSKIELETGRRPAPPATAGSPMMIPQPRHQTGSASWAAMLATSPQVHAQAHAAAMAAVHMQMSLHQDQAALGSSYSAAHSLQRIVTSTATTMVSAPAGQSLPPLGTSLPVPMFSPPSRSFGVHLQGALQDMPPSFDSGDQRVMPLLQLPGATEIPANSLHFQPSSFQPFSVNTFHSAMASAAALSTASETGEGELQGGSMAQMGTHQGELGSGASRWSDQQWTTPIAKLQSQSAGSEPSATQDSRTSAEGSAGGTPHKERSASAQEDVQNSADWDPLWR